MPKQKVDRSKISIYLSDEDGDIIDALEKEVEKKRLEGYRTNISFECRRILKKSLGLGI